MGRGKKVLVSRRLSPSSSLKFMLIMILLIAVYQFASTWRLNNPWLWNSATTVKIPEISAAQSQPPPAAPARDVTNRPAEVLGFSEAVHVSTQGNFTLGFLIMRGIIRGSMISSRSEQKPQISLPRARSRQRKGRSSRTSAINAGRNYWWLWITISGLVILMLFVVLFCYRRKLKGKKEEEAMLHELTTSDGSTDLDENGNNGNHGHKLKVFNFDSIMIATNNFSSQNKIGKGGFGDVYKGKLIDGQEIAVKRLSRGSGQGLVEFKNEIRLISNLQHINIVRLIGCSISGEERILIYEFMPNKSLDFFLFDAICKKLLDWKKRYNIIEGIAQGLLYLHKYSRLRIIHRDLKASNILLDHDMNPKISDFGMARIVRPNAIEATTKRIVGTIGYMSPEYATNGIFSMKSDVYSFGVLMLEIISGRKNKIFHHNDSTINLVGYAWDLWKEGRSLELVDPELGVSNSTAQMLRCIHVAMLCVQGNAANRPTVSDAIFMLTNETVPLPTPTLPIASVNHTGGLGSCATSLTISEMEAR